MKGGLMAYKVFVAGEEALASDVNSLLMSQSVSRFANAAQRTSQLTAPVLNQLSMLDTRPGVKQYWDGGAWKDESPVLLAYTESAQAQGGITSTPVDVNGLGTGSITLPAGRRLRMEASAAFVKSGAETAGTIFLRVQDAGLTQQQTVLGTCPPNTNITLYVSKVITPAAGTYAFKCMCWNDASTASRQVATFAWIQITDLGVV
jgi:hypothetical protein